jgi:DNA polymerase
MASDDRTRLAYLDAMGIQAWSLRVAAFSGGEGVGHGADGNRCGEVEVNPFPPQEPVTETIAHRRVGRLHPPTAKEVGKPEAVCPPYGSDSATPPLPSGVVAPPPLAAADVSPHCNWEDLQAEVVACQCCPLHQTRTQTVFGVGDRQADWMVIGEAPGEQEDLQGEPFVGRAGLLLNEMLRAIGLLREQVYIANILKCRPPGNRDPQADEVAACESFLMRQLALVRPRIILAVGRIAAQQLLKTTTPIGKLRGSVHDYQGVPLVVTYHPAYLLRSPLEKRKAWDDLCLALRTSRTS